jgi:CheY-like chemotaxis protein
VLIVEDELLAAWHVETLVQDLGHVVCGIAARGDEAVQAAANLAPDIVFMDVNLGSGIDGVEAARRIRSVKLVPVVFVTAYSDATTRQRIASAVPEAPILTKPVSPEAVRRVMSGRLKPAGN